MGISSTRSVVTVNSSVIRTAYRIFKILSPFDRTMSDKGEQVKFFLVQFLTCTHMVQFTLIQIKTYKNGGSGNESPRSKDSSGTYDRLISSRFCLCLVARGSQWLHYL